jgi:AcrR family transcriptional regulator
VPYSPDHKRKTRARIVEAARVLFNQHGFENVTIDMLMESAGLTRGGFYNHFESKQALYAEAVLSFLMGRGAEWRADAGVDPGEPGPDAARRMIASYLGAEHLGDLEGQCPMIALPSDVARAGSEVRASYETLLRAMVGLFEQSLHASGVRGPKKRRQRALSLGALCVGGMVLARTLPDSALADEVRSAAQATAEALAKP